MSTKAKGESLVRLTENLPEDPKRRGKIAALYAQHQESSGAAWQQLPHIRPADTPSPRSLEKGLFIP